jgi:hypothetical protein
VDVIGYVHQWHAMCELLTKHCTEWCQYLREDLGNNNLCRYPNTWRLLLLSCKRPGTGTLVSILTENCHQTDRCCIVQSHIQFYICPFLGAFGKSLKANITAVMPVCLSVRPPAWNNSSPIGRIFTKFDVNFFFPRKSGDKVQVWLSCDKNNGYFTWKPL